MESRDMIYALLGIVDRNVVEAVTVFYRLSLADMYANAVKVCNKKEEAFDGPRVCGI